MLFMTVFLSIKTALLRRRSSRRCVLSSDVFELFIVLKGSGVIHFSQFVQLLESEFGFSKLPNMRLGIVCCNILIGSRGLVIKLIENHTDIYAAGATAAPAPGGCAAGVVPMVPPGAAAPSAPCGVMLAIS